MQKILCFDIVTVKTLPLIVIIGLLLILLVIIGLKICVFSGSASINVTYFNYRHLDDDEKHIYESIYKSIQNKTTHIDVGDCAEEIAGKVYRRVLLDHPEIFWLSGSYSFCASNKGNELRAVLVINLDLIDKYKRRLEKEVSLIIKKIAKFRNPYDRILAIHDYIIDHTRYDDEAERDFDAWPISATAYGCIVNHRALCSGYSKAFQLLLNRMGIDCGYVSGICNDGVRHAWNYVKYKSDFYYVDVMFDDPERDNIKYDNKRRSYFFVTTADILKTREIIEDGRFIPECQEITFNYFVYKHKYYEAYSMSALRKLVKSTKDRQIEFRFSDKDVYMEAVERLFADEECYRVTGKSRVGHYEDDDLYIISLFY